VPTNEVIFGPKNTLVYEDITYRITLDIVKGYFPLQMSKEAYVDICKRICVEYNCKPNKVVCTMLFNIFRDEGRFNEVERLAEDDKNRNSSENEDEDNEN